MTAMIAFLSSSIFRWLAGELLGVFKARADRRAEQDAAVLQRQIAADEHARRIQIIELERANGLQMVRVESEAALAEIEARGYLAPTGATTRTTGDVLVDRLNGLVRPLLAYVSIILLAGNSLAPEHVSLLPPIGDLVGAVLGLYVGGRIHVTGR